MRRVVVFLMEDRLRLQNLPRRNSVLSLVGHGARNTAAAFHITLPLIPMPPNAPRTGNGSPPPSPATGCPIIRLRTNPARPVVVDVIMAVGNVRRMFRAPLNFVPWVSPHAPLRAQAVSLVILSALIPPMNLNRAADVPRSTKDRIVPLLRVHGTSDVNKAVAQVRGPLLYDLPSYQYSLLVYTCASGFRHSQDGKSCIASE